MGFLAAAALVFAAIPGCNGGEKAPDLDPYQADPEGRAPPERVELTDDDYEALYLKWSARLESEPDFAKSKAFPAAKADLRRIANEAKDVHLRANGAFVLGALHSMRGENAEAIDFYRLSSKLIANAPGERQVDDAGPFMALAAALTTAKKYPEAIEAQSEATKLDPDNLENWLALAELYIKSGDEESATKAYVDYEVRRKGLIDGLTLKKGDAYRADPPGRIGCAEALASAVDGGTAVAMLYALKSDPAPKVREAVARVMGIQRLSMYKDALTEFVTAEKDPEALESAKWALAEIARDPVEATAVAKKGDGKAPDEVKPAKPDG